MTHLDTGTLQTLLDGELNGADRAAVDAHVAACEVCAAEITGLREAAGAFAGAMAVLDVPAPMLAARVHLEQRHGQDLRRRAFAIAGLAPRALLRAAAVVLLVTGAASAAIPGSPVRRWAGDLLDRAARMFAGEVTQAPAVAAPPVTDRVAPSETAGLTPVSGVGAALADGSIQISLRSVAEGARVTIRLTDERNASAETLRPAGETPQYRSSTGRIDVVGVPAEGIVLIRLPARAREATVEINGRLYYARRDGEERIVGPGAIREDGAITFEMQF